MNKFQFIIIFFVLLVHSLIFYRFGKKSTSAKYNSSTSFNSVEINIKKNTPQIASNKIIKDSQKTNSISHKGVKSQAQLEGSLNPSYPYLSRVYNEEGQVSIEIQIDNNGKVSNVSITSSSGFHRLDQAAVEAARHGKYLPAKNDENKPIFSSLSIDLSFSIK